MTKGEEMSATVEYLREYRARPEAKVKKRRVQKASHDRARRIINEAKGAPCVDCGGQYPPCVMDFDHVRGIKRFCVGSGLTHGEATLRAEIAKCDVVCSNCHRERTWLGSSRSPHD